MIDKNHQNPALTIIKLGAELGLVAQLVEHRLCKAEALGPNPSKSIEKYHAHIEADSMWKGGGPHLQSAVLRNRAQALRPDAH